MACDLHHEDELRAAGHRRVCGIDEAGRGPLAGPVAVAAVVLPDGFRLAGLDDSKKLTARKRDQLFAALTTAAGIDWACVLVEADEIDRRNILAATHEGMRRAVAALRTRADVALIDGLPVRMFPVPQRALVGGDGLSLSIAAASVIAKVTRDRIMGEWDARYPQYGFAKHKGYGTKDHLADLHRHGPCPCHRRSFSPVAQAALPFAAGDP